MSAYELPTSLTVGGVDFTIRTDYRAILDILIALNDKVIDDRLKPVVILEIMYPDFKNISQENLQEAINKACWFIDCGKKYNDGKHIKPKLVDWEQDAGIIIPAVNKVAHVEIRSLEYLHWWTFMSYFMEIGDSLFSSVVSYRKKRAEHKKIEKWEKEFYNENKELIDFESSGNARPEEEVRELKKLWG